jgi:hypothetical protein
MSAAAVLSLHSLWAQGYVDPVDSRPDVRRLYERVAHSNFVVTGRVVDAKPVAKRSVRDITPTVDSSGASLYTVSTLDLAAGVIFTVDVERPLCQQSDFSAASSASPPLPGRVHVFLPSGRTSVPSDLAPGSMTAPEWLVTGRRYLLFLYSYPDGERDKLNSTYEIDPAVGYYRAFEGWRGARELPEGARIGSRGDLVTPAVSVISSFCGAVQTPGVLAKIAQLKALAYSADPAWRDSVAAAIQALQATQPK